MKFTVEILLNAFFSRDKVNVVDNIAFDVIIILEQDFRNLLIRSMNVYVHEYTRSHFPHVDSYFSMCRLFCRIKTNQISLSIAQNPFIRSGPSWDYGRSFKSDLGLTRNVCEYESIFIIDLVSPLHLPLDHSNL